MTFLYRYYPRKIAKALEIQCCGTGQNEVDGISRDSGLRYATESWKSFFYDLGLSKTKLLRWKNHWHCQDDDVSVNLNSAIIQSNPAFEDRITNHSDR